MVVRLPRSYTINAEEFNYSLAPNLKWINQIYGSEAFDHAKVNSIDKDGNVWVAASCFSATFSDEVSFPNIGNTDALVAKYNGIDGSFHVGSYDRGLSCIWQK